MSGVGILCFSASYAVALCLEISRIFFRSPVRNVLTLFWIVAGLVAHTAYLYYNHAVSPVPIDGPVSYFLVSAWGVVLVYFYLFCFHPGIPFGFVFLPISLLLIGGALLAPEAAATGISSAATVSLWKRLHAGTFFLATLSVCVGFVAGLLYFIQDARLRRKRPVTLFLKLPTLEWSLSVCRQAIGASIFLSGACIFSGLLLRSTSPKPFLIGDPLVWGTILLFAFLLLFSGALSLRLFKTEGRSAAVLTTISFLFLVSILLFGLFRDAHWMRQTLSDPPTSSEEGVR